MTSTSPVCTPARMLLARAPDLTADNLRAADRTRRPVEGAEKPVARGIDFAASVTLEVTPYRGVKALEQIAPSTIANLGDLLG